MFGFTTFSASSFSTSVGLFTETSNGEVFYFDVNIFTQPEYAATITTSFVKDVEIDLRKNLDLELD